MENPLNVRLRREREDAWKSLAFERAMADIAGRKARRMQDKVQARAAHQLLELAVSISEAVEITQDIENGTEAIDMIYTDSPNNELAGMAERLLNRYLD